MELGLNLLWLMLALPAALIWRRGGACPQTSGRSFCSLVLLGCVLALLFPVVSATDDLHPMRAEIEECSPSKRLAKAMSVKSPTCSPSGELPVQMVETASFAPENLISDQVSEYPPAFPDQTLVIPIGGRAPPQA
jgi:hypothetical protein